MAAIFSILAIHSAGLVIPGPDFFLTVNHSISKSKKEGLFAAFGLTTGITILGILSAFCLPSLESTTTFLPYIKGAGVLYLSYLGITALRSHSTTTIKTLQSTSKSRAFTRGVLCNITNPKALIFFLTIFSVFGLELTHAERALCVFCMSSLGLLWFGAVALGLGSLIKKLPPHQFESLQKITKKASGCLFLLFALLVLFV